MPPKNLVLCVDDEPTLLLTLSRILGRVGLRAATANNGADGLNAFLRLREEVCLVLTDIVMPGMNGVEMAQRIRQVEPQVKVLLMSSYSEGVIGRQVRRSGFPFIAKPFTFGKLIEKIGATQRGAVAAMR